MVLYRTPECNRYAELEQAWKYMIVCCVSFHQCKSIFISWTVEQMLWYLSTRCCIPSFKVCTIYGPGIHLVHVNRTFEQIFIWGFIWSLALNVWPSYLLGIEVWKCWNWVTLDKGQWMLLTFGCHKSPCTHLFDYMYLGPSSMNGLGL